MQLPFYVLIILFAVGVLLFFTLSIFDLYHLVRYEAFTTKSKVYLTIYTLLFIGIIVGSLAIVGHIDWLDTFNVFGYGTARF